MWEFGRASDAEALELMVAFLQISEPQRRAEVLAFARTQQAESVPLRHQPSTQISQDNAPLQIGVSR